MPDRKLEWLYTVDSKQETQDMEMQRLDNKQGRGCTASKRCWKSEEKKLDCKQERLYSVHRAEDAGKG
jgi:hypothetical protein